MSGVLDTDFDWNPEQEEIIEHEDGPLQVIACAGSGKTTTVSARIAQLVHNGVDRDSILAFTFTENAAEELKVRVREWMHRADLENEQLGNMYIDTIHSFCQDLLNDYRPNTLSYDVLSKNELAAFLSQKYWDIGLPDLPPSHPEARYEKIKWFMDDIDTIRRELLVEELRESEEEHATQLSECYEEYQRLMDQYHFFDFQELVHRAVTLLEQDMDILEEIQNEYEYIIVDEYQDVDPAQQRLIQLLAGDNRNLCVVGDDDQSIYNWRGARPEDFRSFSDDYGADRETLAQNFRSTDLIVDIAQGLIQNNDNRIDKPMETDREHDIGDVHQCYFEEESEEIDFIADRIEDLVGTVYEDPKGNEQSLRYGDIGMLFRRRQDIEEVQNELEARGIPYTVRGPNNIFDHPVAGFVRLAFAYVARGQEDDDDEDYIDTVEIIDVEESDPRKYEPIERYAVTETDLRTAIQNSRHLRDREEQIIEELNEIQDWYRNPSSRRIEPQTELHRILNAMGIKEIPENADDLSTDGFPEPVMYNIGQISELVKDFETVYEIIFPDQITSLVDYLDYAYFFADSEIEDPTRVDAVDLLTIHSSKGMEYPAVFMPSLTRQKFSDTSPPRSFMRSTEWIPEEVFDYEQYQDGPEELRRLFYVGVTRAQKYLSITGASDNIGYVNNQSPSPFYRDVENLELEDIMRERGDPTPREQRDIPRQAQDYVFPTSFSDLRYYRKCPYDYKLRKIYGFAPPIDQAFGFGFAVHDLLREMHQRHDIENQQMVMWPAEIKQNVQDEDRFHLRYASGEIEENLRKSAEEMLINYSQEYTENLTSTYRAEVPFELLLAGEERDGTTLVSGEIDLLERRNPETDEIEEVDVVDYKTSEQPDDLTEELLDNRFQVRLYGLATQAELDPTSADGYIHYLDPEDGGRIEVELTDQNIQTVENWVQDMVERIMQRRFHATPDPEVCGDCDYNEICPHAELE